MVRPGTDAHSDAWIDINAALHRHYLATAFSWQDVAQRYRRSRIGAFWLTINMGVLIGAMGGVFGTLFRSPLQEFLPFICISLIFWGFISSSISEGCTSFISAEGIILQVRMPLFIHVLRTLYRNAIILGHNILIYPLVLLAVARAPSSTIFLAAPGFVLVCLNILWMMLILGVICARYRDMTQIIQNFLQVLMYLTPVMWMPESFPGSYRPLIDLNPFFHLVSLVRLPFLGHVPTLANWLTSLGLAAFGWAIAYAFFARYHRRVPYWL